MPTINPGDADQVRNYYRTYLGREAADTDPESWLSGAFGYGTDLNSIQNAIRYSDEGRAYSSKQPPTTPTVPTQPGLPRSTTTGAPAGVPTQPTPTPTPTPAAPVPNYWDPNVFASIVGRKPTDPESSYYAPNPNWYTEVQRNTPGYQAKTPWDPNAFQQVTGRAPSETETAYYSRRGDTWLDEVKKNTPGYTAPASTTGGTDWITKALQDVQSTDDPAYWQRVISADPKAMAGDPSAIAYWQDRIRRGDGSALVRSGQLQPFQDSASGGASYGGTNVFDDPATANFEKLLNDLIGNFLQPQTPPGYQQAIDQMNAYLAQLNGPVYTPAEMELMQTQSWDPMQQQQDAARQQVIQRFGAQGIPPSSGIVQQALQDLDRQFQQAHTKQQGDFANQAIGLSRQNAAMAAGLAPQISNFQQAQTQWQDQRNLQGEALAYLIPQMAQQRISGASNAVNSQGLNPMSLLSMINQFQTQGYNRGADTGNMLFQLLAQLFGI